MDENTVFCGSCGARQITQDVAQPATGNTINTASAEAAASSSEFTQPEPQSPNLQQNQNQPVQEFVQQPQNVMQPQSTVQYQNAAQPRSTAQPQNAAQPQSTVQYQNAVQSQGTAQYQNAVQPQNVVRPQTTAQYQSTVNQKDLRKPMSVWQFLLMFIILAVPILNIIMVFVWAFGSKANLNKKNLSRAYLIVVVVMIVLWIAVGASIMSIFGGITGPSSSFNDIFKKAGEEIISNVESKGNTSGLDLGKAMSMLTDTDPSKWPKERLNPDMPEYKKGKMNGWSKWNSTDEYSIFILIKDTGKADLDEYISQLKSAGFEAINKNSFRKGIYDVELQFNSDTILQISSYKAEVYEWPKELAGIPPIKKGNLTAVTGPSEDYADGIQLYYINLTEEDLTEWGKTLKTKGFEVDGLAIYNKNKVSFNDKAYGALYLQIEENGSNEWIIDFMYSE